MDSAAWEPGKLELIQPRLYKHHLGLILEGVVPVLGMIEAIQRMIY